MGEYPVSAEAVEWETPTVGMLRFAGGVAEQFLGDGRWRIFREDERHCPFVRWGQPHDPHEFRYAYMRPARLGGFTVGSTYCDGLSEQADPYPSIAPLLCQPLADEVERLTKKLADYEADWVPMISDREGLRIDSRGVMVSMRGARRVVKTVAAAMARMLGDATNYVECEMKPAGEPGYTVTIRRSEKPTPHELRQRAEAEVERLKAIVEESLRVLSSSGGLSEPSGGAE